MLLISMVFISSVAYAEKGDNTAPPLAEEKPAVLKTTSYFQGTWVGKWEYGGVTGRDITITVGPKNPNGTFNIEYSWGAGQSMDARPMSPGMVKTKGREDGGKLAFEFSDPTFDFKTVYITLTKYEDVRAMALAEIGMVKLVSYLTRK